MNFQEFKVALVGKTIKEIEPGFTPGWVLIHLEGNGITADERVFMTAHCGGEVEGKRSGTVGLHQDHGVNGYHADWLVDERFRFCEIKRCHNEALQDNDHNKALFDTARCHMHQPAPPCEYVTVGYVNEPAQTCGKPAEHYHPYNYTIKGGEKVRLNYGEWRDGQWHGVDFRLCDEHESREPNGVETKCGLLQEL